MTIILKAGAVAAIALAGATAVLAPLATAGNTTREGARLADRAGATLDLGTKRAVAYYVKDANTCQVSVIVSETYPEQIPFELASVRFSTSVPAGTSSEIATSDGGLIALSCDKGADALTVESRDSLAWSPATN